MKACVSVGSLAFLVGIKDITTLAVCPHNPNVHFVWEKQGTERKGEMEGRE